MFRPTKLQSTLDRMNGKSSLFCPLSDPHGPAVDRKTNGAALIFRLFWHRNPFAIIRAVVAVYVFTLYRMTFWHWAEVGQEIRETVLTKPFITNGNATTAIRSVARIFRIIASLLHVVVRVVSWSRSRLRRVSVSIQSLAGNFTSKAPATFHVAGLQAVCATDCIVAAIATAFPKLVICSVFTTNVPMLHASHTGCGMARAVQALVASVRLVSF
jgi:hypothetical protein